MRAARRVRPPRGVTDTIPTWVTGNNNDSKIGYRVANGSEMPQHPARRVPAALNDGRRHGGATAACTHTVGGAFFNRSWSDG